MAIFMPFSLLFAQETSLKESYAIHPKAGVSLNLHSADFRNFSGSADCGLFKSGFGTGLSAGLFFEKAINNVSFAGLGFAFINRSATLTVGNTFPSRDLITNEIVNVKTDNNLEATLNYLEIQPEYRYQILDDFIAGPLRLLFGYRFVLPVSSSFNQKEEIKSPAGAVFINEGLLRSKTRNISSGDITTINGFGHGISLGVENMLKTGKSSFFTQQLVFDWNFSDIASDAKWTAYAVRLELGWRYSFKEAEPEVIKPQPPPPIQPEPIKEIIIAEPTYSLAVKDFIGKINTGNELLATVPLVNSIFFERNSAAIPTNYKFETTTDNIYFNGNAVELHDFVLPRIAMIVRDNPKASVVLQSATSGTNEPEGIELSRRRAEEVKKKLLTLGLSEDRIKIDAKTTPQFKSNQDFPEGISENQRVDIIVKNAPLQEYVDIQKYRELLGKLLVDVNYENYPQGTKAKLAVNLDNSITVVDKPGEYSLPVRTRISEASQKEPYELIFNVMEEKHLKQGELDLNVLPVEVIELNLDNFEAILRFDYNISTLSDDNKELLRQLAAKLPTGATIQILGSADALGTEERNLILSQERASNTEQFIKSVSSNKFKIETGINQDKFDEKTPQGRFLNRSIRIKVKQ